MKLSYLAFLGVTLALACSSSTSDDDAGGTDAGNDATADATTDAATNDGGGGNDGSTTDATADTGGGTLDGGDTCDLENDQCGPGLICCAGGIALPDAGKTGHCVTRPDSGKCPPIP